MLPVNDDGQPDYSFMEAYMRAVEKRLLLQYKIYQVNLYAGSEDIRIR